MKTTIAVLFLVAAALVVAQAPNNDLGYILADMQFLQRAYPGATW